MRKLFLIILLGIGLLSGEMKSPMAKEIEKMRFPPLKWSIPQVGGEIAMDSINGSVLFVKENHNIPLIEITIYVKGGHLYLEPEKRAICELLAPMIERGGTKDLSPQKFSDILEYNAIDFSVDEGPDHYTIKLSCMKEVLDTAIYLLKEAMFYPAFDREILEIEEGRLKDSWRKKLENPGDALWTLAYYVTYRGSPAGELPDFSVFEGNTVKELKRIHHLFFVPENIIIGAVGDITLNEIKEKFRDFVPDYTGNNPLKLKPFGKEPEPGVYFYQLPIPQGYVLIQQEGSQDLFKEMYDVVIMDEILGGGGFTSRVVLKVRNEMGLAYSTYTYYNIFSYPFPPHFYAFSATRASAVHDAIQAIIHEIKRIREEKVSDEELRVAKESYINGIITRYSNDWRFLARILNLYIKNLPLDYYASLSKNIDTVGVEGVLRAAKKYLMPEKLIVFIVGDTSRIDVDKLKEFGEVKFINMEVKGL